MEALGNLPLDGRDQKMDAYKDSEEEDVRRSGQLRNPTENKLVFQREEAHKKQQRLIHLYEQWNTQVCKAREQLKSDIPESQIAVLTDTLEKGKDNITNIYVEVRDHFIPSSETRRHVDACEAVTKLFGLLLKGQQALMENLMVKQ